MGQRIDILPILVGLGWCDDLPRGLVYGSRSRTAHVQPHPPDTCVAVPRGSPMDPLSVPLIGGRITTCSYIVANDQELVGSETVRTLVSRLIPGQIRVNV